MSDVERLLEALRDQASGRARVPIEGLWAAFRTAIRGYTGSAEARRHLAGLLGSLQARGALELPKGRRLWDARTEPPLPAWARLVSPSLELRVERDHRTVAWPPELAFVGRLRRAPLLDELLAVRRFLADGGRERVRVPSSERSLELFGDEKRIAALRKTSLFRPGRLSLELLRCYDVAPPLVWEPAPVDRSGGVVLVLENLDAYDSFCRWNADTAAYAVVAYGHGSEFLATVRDLPRVCEWAGTTRVEYFGDLDLRGLQIPHRARSVLLGVAPELTLAPAERWYAALLSFADAAAVADAEVDPRDPALDWLPPALRGDAAALLSGGRRLPQEHIGLEHLLATSKAGGVA